MTPPTRWWWIRHAPVPDSAGRLNGRLDLDCDVSDVAAMRALAQLLPGEAVAIVSPLRRTRQTFAAIVAAGSRLGAPVVEPDFIEQSFGRWQGLTWVQMQAADPQDYARFWEQPMRTPPPGGESFCEQMRRTATAIDRLGARYAGGDIVCVSHGGTIRAAVAAALGLAPEQAMAITVDNLSVTCLDRLTDGLHPTPGDAWRLVCLNAPCRW